MPSLKSSHARRQRHLPDLPREGPPRPTGTSTVHDRRNVSCISCHSVHAAKSAKALLKTRAASETCYACHKSERAKDLRTSHHPVREGKMECTGCHNPHDGSRPKMMQADSTNELCYTCHTEKRGPFLYEHAPVREDVRDLPRPARLEPRAAARGEAALPLPALPLLGSLGSPPTTRAPWRGCRSRHGCRAATTSSRNTERGCQQCHLNIHGSNSPSGAFFVR